MARKREALSLSVAVETSAKLADMVREIEQIIAVPVHAGILVDLMTENTTTENIMRAMLRSTSLQEVTNG